MVSFDLYTIGERVFFYNLAFSVIASFIGAALIAGGAPREILSLPIFTGSAVYFYMTANTINQLPVYQTNITSPYGGNTTGWVITDVNTFNTITSMAGALSIFVNILVNTALGMANLMITILAILPGELRFLIPPIIFIFSFLQLALTYYLFTKIRELLSNIYVVFR